MEKRKSILRTALALSICTQCMLPVELAAEEQEHTLEIRIEGNGEVTLYADGIPQTVQDGYTDCFDGETAITYSFDSAETLPEEILFQGSQPIEQSDLQGYFLLSEDTVITFIFRDNPEEETDEMPPEINTDSRPENYDEILAEQYAAASSTGRRKPYSTGKNYTFEDRTGVYYNGSTVAEKARQWVGKLTYGYGVKNPKEGSIDCSGFVTWIIREYLGTMQVDWNGNGSYGGYTFPGSKYLLATSSNPTNSYVTSSWYTAGYGPGIYYLGQSSSSIWGKLYVDSYGIGDPYNFDVGMWGTLLSNGKKNTALSSGVACSDAIPAGQEPADGFENYTPGDIIIFYADSAGTDLYSQIAHMGIYSGNGKMIHASYSFGGTVETDVTAVHADSDDALKSYRIFRMSDGEKTTAAITSQPVSVSVDAGSTARFSVSASGNGLKYQWQYRKAGENSWTNSSMTGATSRTVSIPAVPSRNGQQYRCRITDKWGNTVVSDPAVLSVNKTELILKEQPVSTAAETGTTAVFSVLASGYNLTYQWQYQKAGETIWTNSTMNGAKTRSVSVPAALSRNGQQYRCVIKDGYGSQIISDPALLTVRKSELNILSQPQSVSAALGENAVFTVSASGTGLTYQWQYQKTGETIWSDSGMNGSKTSTVTIPASAGRNGQKYRCLITDIYGQTAVSETAILEVVLPELKIISQPRSVTIQPGRTAVFSVTASGTGLSYQWQYKKAGESSWTNSGMSGAKTSQVSVPATASRNGQEYRCIVTDTYGNSAVSASAKLQLSQAGVTILTQPTSVTQKTGTTAVFSVTASGTGLTYQWQYKKAEESTWTNSGMSGAKTSQVSLPATNSRNGQEYRCIVTDAYGNSAVSASAKLLLSQTGLTILTQPSSVTQKTGTTAVFSVTASGTGLSYQWQYKKAGESTWTNSTMSGAKTSQVSVPVADSRNSQAYRCLIKDAYGNSVTSDSAYLYCRS